VSSLLRVDVRTYVWTVWNVGRTLLSGNSVRTHVAITVDTALLLRARQEGVNLSRLMDKALESLWTNTPSDPTPEQLADQAMVDRDTKMGEALTESLSKSNELQEKALMEVQPIWNVYISHGDRPLEAKLEWIRAHRGRRPGLQLMTVEAILKQLEGS